MTTLAGLHIPGKGTWIASDSQATSDNLKIGPVGKWVRRGAWAVGCAGDFKTICVMQGQTDTLLNGATSAGEVVQRLEKLLVTNNFAAGSDGPFGPPIWGQSFLIASDHGLWDVDMSLGLFAVPANTLWAAGSGRDFALGAGFGAAQNPDAAERVRLAIEAAMAFDVMSGHGGWFDHIASETTIPAKKARNRT